ncbi:peritrophin-1-like [Monomorium pharaonis]|uniref:peritrophin-1-like n=1 Tax=Monomorium pharaonis TaxID=307658 RepID=UPI001747C252|nr:peritrophin-1-like [Monomorium pharaonis]
MRAYCAIIIVSLTLTIGEFASQIPKKLPAKMPECPLLGTIRMPHPKDCTLYYICRNGNRELHSCPDGLHFNNVIQQCDWPSAGCRPELNRPETLPREIESEEIINGCIDPCPISDPTDKTIHLPYNGDCTKFCTCSNGIPIPQNCSAGLHFDKTVSVCNWPWQAKCKY